MYLITARRFGLRAVIPRGHPTNIRIIAGVERFTMNTVRHGCEQLMDGFWKVAEGQNCPLVR